MAAPLSPNFNPVYQPFPAQQQAPQGAFPGPESFGMPQEGLSGMPQLPQGLPQDTFGAPPPNAAPSPDMQALAQALGQQPGMPGAPPAPAAGAPQPGAAQQAGVYQHESGGFAEKNTTLSSGDSLTSKIFSLKGMAIGLGAIAAGVLTHKLATGKFFWEAKEAASQTWQSTKDTVHSYINDFQTKVQDPVNNAISNKSTSGLEDLKTSFTNDVITPAKTLATEDADKPIAEGIETEFNKLVQKAEEKIKNEQTDALAEADFKPVKESLTKFHDDVATPKAQAAQEPQPDTSTPSTPAKTGDDVVDDVSTPPKDGEEAVETVVPKTPEKSEDVKPTPSKDASSETPAKTTTPETTHTEDVPPEKPKTWRDKFSWSKSSKGTTVTTEETKVPEKTAEDKTA